MEDKNKKPTTPQQSENDSQSNNTANKKQKKGEEVDLDKVEEPITERVSRKIPKRKPLGPSGQEWDV